ncbi:MAG TPA: magnesium transporter [Desulfatirhabdiaceae bacterium]|nr:magnesium transporter [Desulfatirhabdiaceae bacterium]
MNIQADRNKILVESVKRLLRRDAISHLRKIVNKTHAADLSSVFRTIPVSSQRKLFDLIDKISQKGALFSYLDKDIFLELIEGIPIERVVEVLESMPTDDVADLIASLPPEKSDAILKTMKKEGLEEVEGLLRYGDETAGGIMAPDFIALTQDMTARESIEAIQREHHDVEMAFYLYVVDEYGRLVGVSSLRQLVVASPEKALKDFMVTDVFSVQTGMDQEEVAKIVARYDLLAVPVVDDNNKLVGIVTVDDVIDIIRQEATEDILKMAGAGDEFVENKSIMKSSRLRLPWLFASCLGGIVASFIIAYFEDSLQKMAYLAVFITVICGMGGNVGTQSATIVVRGLATGRINIRELWKVVFKELSTGFILGSIYGVLIGCVAQFRYGIAMFALAVGLAVICSMSAAGLIGSLVPMVLAKINIDPAVATGPFVSTTLDSISVSCYFFIATALVSL